jgi:hypothetical protein
MASLKANLKKNKEAILLTKQISRDEIDGEKVNKKTIQNKTNSN